MLIKSCAWAAARVVDPKKVVENMLGVVLQSHNTEQMLDALRKKMAESCAPSKGHG